ncbi:MAG: PUA domain-containing protein [Nitrososphaerales archaeon]
MDYKVKIAMIVDYLFGKGVSKSLPLDELEFIFSPKTKRLRKILLNGKLVATVRPDGGLALTVFGAELLSKNDKFMENCLIIQDDAINYVSQGRSVFCKHVVKCGKRIKPSSEVVVLNSYGRVLAVGKAILSAKMIKKFKEGVAVKIRQGVMDNV